MTVVFVAVGWTAACAMVALATVRLGALADVATATAVRPSEPHVSGREPACSGSIAPAATRRSA